MKPQSRISKIVLCAIVLAIVPAHVRAKEEKTNAAPQKGKPPAAGVAFETACQAAALVLRGEANKSPMMLLAAAEMLMNLAPSQRDVSVVQAAVTGGDPADSKDALPKLEPDALIARARELAKDDPELLKAVETAAAQLTDGSRAIEFHTGKNLPKHVIGGITYVVLNWEPQNQRLDPGYEYTVRNVVFEGKKPALVQVIGDGDGDLDLWVYDGNSGGLIGQDTDTTSICVVGWEPIYEGPFTIKVGNVGATWERFFVLANW
jgi:hypothetical protein